jgi:hypothetical protein
MRKIQQFIFIGLLMFVSNSILTVPPFESVKTAQGMENALFNEWIDTNIQGMNQPDASFLTVAADFGKAQNMWMVASAENGYRSAGCSTGCSSGCSSGCSVGCR